jgi:hypothetical protein
MAKMFYTLEEVADKLGTTEDDVREMAASGQIQEFRDRDKLMFKVDQIDLLAGGDEDHGEVTLELEDSAVGGSGLGMSGSALNLTDSSEGSGISVFDTDHGDEGTAMVGSPGADDDGTHVGETLDDDLSLEAVGSGSGLLDLTRESEDTSLGAELLEEVYSGEDNIEIPANASGLFEAAADATPEEAIAATSVASAMPMVVEVYDGSGSGLTVGMMIGAMAALVVTALVVAVGLMGSTSQVAMKFSGNLMVWCGAILGATILFGLIGLFIGKSTE